MLPTEAYDFVNICLPAIPLRDTLTRRLVLLFELTVDGGAADLVPPAGANVILNSD